MKTDTIQINVTGDFNVKELEGLEFDSELQDILSKADINITNFEGPVKGP